jgi:hypothetical protein
MKTVSVRVPVLTRSVLLAGVLAAISLSGCATAKPAGTCGLESCDPGLSITVRGARDSDITVKISSADGQGKSFECDAVSATCEAFFADYTPENVSVTITKKEGNSVHSYNLTYNNVRPNGTDCPPVCKQAHIDVNM